MNPMTSASEIASAMPPPIPLDAFEGQEAFLRDYLENHLLRSGPSVDEAVRSMSCTSGQWVRVEITPVWQDQFDETSRRAHRKEGWKPMDGLEGVEGNLLKIALNGRDERFLRPQQFVSLALRLNEEVQTEDCGECNGHGSLICGSCRGDRAFPCRACNEAGHVRCNACDGGYAICSRCKGSGQTQSLLGQNGPQRCTSCSGAGRVKCNKCRNGDRVCEKCSGKGHTKCKACGARGEIGCDECKSTGRLDVVNQRVLRVFSHFSLQQCFASEGHGSDWRARPSPRNVFERQQTWVVTDGGRLPARTGLAGVDEVIRLLLGRVTSLDARQIYAEGTTLAGIVQPVEEPAKSAASSLCSRLAIDGGDLILHADGDDAEKIGKRFKAALRTNAPKGTTSKLMLCFVHLSGAQEESIAFQIDGVTHNISRWTRAEKALQEADSLASVLSGISDGVSERLLANETMERDKAAATVRGLASHGRNDTAQSIISSTLKKMGERAQEEAERVGTESAVRLFDARLAVLHSIDPGALNSPCWHQAATGLYNAATRGHSAYKEKFTLWAAMLLGLWLLSLFLGMPGLLSWLIFGGGIALPYVFPSPIVSFLRNHQKDTIGQLLNWDPYSDDLCDFPHSPGGKVVFAILGVIALLVLVF